LEVLAFLRVVLRVPVPELMGVPAPERSAQRVWAAQTPGRWMKPGRQVRREPVLQSGQQESGPEPVPM
jgi:hypothetical protein